MKPMKDLPSVRIEAPDGTGITAKVFVDDVEQRGLTHVSFDVDAKSVTEVTMERIASVTFSGRADAKDHWDVRAFLTVPQQGGAVHEYTGSGSTLSEALRDIAALVGQDERNGVLRG